MAKAVPKNRSHQRKEPKPEKKGDVEIVGGVEVEKAIVDEGQAEPAAKKPRGSRGPKSGEDAPLFGAFAAPDAEFGIDLGELTIRFDIERSAWSLDKDQAVFASDIASAYIKQLPAGRKANDEDDGSEIRRANSMVVIAFSQPIKVWRMSKALARLKIGHLRVEARALPRVKTD